jgi:hypothetical protein
MSDIIDGPVGVDQVIEAFMQWTESGRTDKVMHDILAGLLVEARAEWFRLPGDDPRRHGHPELVIVEQRPHQDHSEHPLWDARVYDRGMDREPSGTGTGRTRDDALRLAHLVRLGRKETRTG